MSKAKYDLSVTQRLFLDYVKFKTHNNIPFFMGNEKIADALDLTVNSAKIMVNTLVRGGYLNKEKDKSGRRVLSLTSKEYKPLFEDLRNIDKKLLKRSGIIIKMMLNIMNSNINKKKLIVNSFCEIVKNLIVRILV